MPNPTPFTPTREAVSKLLIASTDFAEAEFHFLNALKRIEEAAQLAPEGGALRLSCSLLKLLAVMSSPRASVESLRTELHKLAAIHYPEVLTEEI